VQITEKKIVLFSDGTGNSSAKAEKTNVWRAFQALDQLHPDQIAKYDDGVGTSSNKYLALLGGAFGWGLKRNVIDLYKFICVNYRPKDEIYGFGFSRGAFTIRVLVDLITSEGLVSFQSAEELDRHSRGAYRRYRVAHFPSRSPIVGVMRLLRDGLLALRDRILGFKSYQAVRDATAAAGRAEIPIRFVGLWDTVEAYGMPVRSLKRAISLALWPMLTGDRRLAPNVRRACHALSLDDERATFHPLLWDETAEAQMVQDGRVPKGRITQVWFAGVHSNVGGGYPEDQLSLIPLEWMFAEAVGNGLRFDLNALAGNRVSMSPYARLYDSRAGWASYYAYAPRRIYVRRDPTAPIGSVPPQFILPIVHGSVIMRMAYGTDRYSPISLPHEFWVLAPDGALLPMEGAPLSLRLDATKTQKAGVAPDWVVSDTIAKSRAVLQAGIDALSRPSRDLIRQVWDLVFWRQVLYVLTMFVSALLLLYPLIMNAFPDVLGRTTVASNAPVFAQGLAQSLRQPISQLLPSYLKPWVGAIEHRPIEAGILIALLVALMAGSRILQQRIHDTASSAWRSGRGPTPVRRSAMTYQWGRSLLAALLAFAAGAAIAWSAHAQSLAKGLGGSAAVALVLLLFTLTGHRIVTFRQPKPVRDSTAIPSVRDTNSLTLALALARILRYDRRLRLLYWGTTQAVLPGLFVVAILWVAACLANAICYSLYDAAGAFCIASPASELTTSVGEAVTHVNINEPCQDTGYRVALGQRYRVTVTADKAWFDHEIETDVHGFGANDLIHVTAVLLKRHWSAPWFRPFVRVGAEGAEEYAVAPDVEAQAPAYPICRPALGQNKTSHSDPINDNQARSCNEQAPIARERRSVSMVFTAHSKGPLYFYVNDAALGWPRGFGRFYRNNVGTAEIDIDPIQVP
jgi:uncharacterized protein (DUF2235 family)